MDTLVIPAASNASHNLVGTVLEEGARLGFGTFIVAAGVFGLIERWPSMEKYWWVFGGGLWAAVQVFLFDFDGGADLLLGMVFVCLGFGLFVSGRKATTARKGLVAIVLVTVAISALFQVGLILNQPGDPITLSESMEGGISPEMGEGQLESIHTIYWEKQYPESCYYTVAASGDLMAWVQKSGADLMANTCPRV